jgi:hypothetical protein
MSYAVRTTVSAPIEVYDVVHAEVISAPEAMSRGSSSTSAYRPWRASRSSRSGSPKAASDRSKEELIGPIITELSQRRPGPAPQMTVDEFDLHGLILPGHQVVS